MIYVFTGTGTGTGTGGGDMVQYIQDCVRHKLIEIVRSTLSLSLSPLSPATNETRSAHSGSSDQGDLYSLDAPS
jgi:hypothetical protein